MALTAVLLAIPPAFGFVVARRLLVERSLGTAVCTGLGIGTLGTLFAANLLLPWMSLRAAALGAGAIQALLTLILVARRPAPTCRGLPWTESLALIGLSLSVGAYALLNALRFDEPDSWIYSPEIEFFLRGLPRVNPLLPDLLMKGQFGRLLLFAVVAKLSGVDALRLPWLLEPVLLACSVVVLFGAARRHLPGRASAVLACLLAFWAAQAGTTSFVTAGMAVQAYGNHILASLAFCTVLRLVLDAFRSRAQGTLLAAGAGLGTLGIVYGSHFVVVVIALAALPLVLSVVSRRVRRRPWVVAWGLVACGLACDFLHGGVLATARWYKPDAAGGDDRRAPGGTIGEDAGTREVGVSFPRRPFLSVTTSAGEEIPLLSWRFLQPQGLCVWLLPVTGCWILRRRPLMPLLLILVAGAGFLLPGLVGFGRFDTDVTRFFALAGVGAACAAGGVLGGLAEVAATTGGRRVAYALLVVLVLGYNGRVGADYFRQTVLRTVRHPEQLSLDPDEAVLKASPGVLSRIDLAVARWLREISVPGDRVAWHLHEEPFITRRALGHLLARAGCPYAGGGYWPERPGDHPGGWFLLYGYRGRAFWSTLDPALLRDLQANWVVVTPADLDPNLRARWEQSGFREAGEFQDGEGHRRAVYHADAGVAALAPQESAADLPGLQVLDWAAAPALAPNSFAVGELRIRNGSSHDLQLERGPALRHRIVDPSVGMVLNARDVLGQTLTGRLAPGADVVMPVRFVTPPVPGRFRLQFFFRLPGGVERTLDPVQEAPPEIQVGEGRGG